MEYVNVQISTLKMVIHVIHAIKIAKNVYHKEYARYVILVKTMNKVQKKEYVFVNQVIH